MAKKFLQDEQNRIENQRNKSPTPGPFPGSTSPGSGASSPSRTDAKAAAGGKGGSPASPRAPDNGPRKPIDAVAECVRSEMARFWQTTLKRELNQSIESVIQKTLLQQSTTVMATVGASDDRTKAIRTSRRQSGELNSMNTSLLHRRAQVRDPQKMDHEDGITQVRFTPAPDGVRELREIKSPSWFLGPFQELVVGGTDEEDLPLLQLSTPRPSLPGQPEADLLDMEDEMEISGSGRILELEPEEEDFGTFSAISAFVQDEVFDQIAAFLILLSALSTGIQADYMARYWTHDLPPYFRWLDYAFCVMFALEYLLRAACYRQTFLLFVSRNLIDCIVVFIQVFDHILELIYPHFDLGPARGLIVLRVVRLLRTIRILRVARLLHIIGELRVLVVSMMSSLKPLMWTVVLIFLITYTLSVYLLQLVTDYKILNRQQVEEEQTLLLTYFGTLDRSFLSLYEAVLEGMSWGYFLDPLLQYCSPLTSFLFLAYVTFMGLAVMNIVTSVYVTTAVKNAEADTQNVVAQSMTHFFEAADEDNSGTVSWEEFQDQLTDDKLQWFLKEIDMDPSQAKGLFYLLDTDETGDISIPDLVSGCIRLHGNAKAIDMTIMLREFGKFKEEWTQHSEAVQTILNAMVKNLDAGAADLRTTKKTTRYNVLNN